jgi:hypothetical protein
VLVLRSGNGGTTKQGACVSERQGEACWLPMSRALSLCLVFRKGRVGNVSGWPHRQARLAGLQDDGMMDLMTMSMSFVPLQDSQNKARANA